MMSYALVHGLYAKLLVWPTFLCYDYSLDAVPLVRTLQDARLLLPLAAYLAFAELLCCACWPIRPTWFNKMAPCGHIQGKLGLPTRQAPIVGLAIVILSFVPMSNVLFPVGTMIGERLLYIPSAGLLLALVGLAQLAGLRGRTSSGAWLSALLLMAGAALVLLCMRRVPEWETGDSITIADGIKQTRSSRVQFNYANVHLQAKRYDEALATYNRAINIDPTDHDALPLYHAGQILFYSGRNIEAERYLEKAVTGYFSPLTIKEEEIFHDYALALWFVGKREASLLNFQKSLAINPTFTKSLNNLGCAAGIGAVQSVLPRDYLHHGLEHLERAVQLEPANILYWRNAVSLLQHSDMNAASAAWNHIASLDPKGALEGPPRECTWEFYFR